MAEKGENKLNKEIYKISKRELNYKNIECFIIIPLSYFGLFLIFYFIIIIGDIQTLDIDANFLRLSLFLIFIFFIGFITHELYYNIQFRRYYSDLIINNQGIQLPVLYSSNNRDEIQRKKIIDIPFNEISGIEFWTYSNKKENKGYIIDFQNIFYKALGIFELKNQNYLKHKFNPETQYLPEHIYYLKVLDYTSNYRKEHTLSSEKLENGFKGLRDVIIRACDFYGIKIKDFNLKNPEVCKKVTEIRHYLKNIDNLNNTITKYKNKMILFIIIVAMMFFCISIVFIPVLVLNEFITILFCVIIGIIVGISTHYKDKNIREKINRNYKQLDIAEKWLNDFEKQNVAGIDG